ncbi:MAG: lytic transglycosylase domain-containing protein [Bacillota bacterium]|nr:lytic transglycosylase domain-containing protein [Bacillota bacterium]
MSPDQVAAVAATIVREAGRYGLDPWLVYAVIRRESNFNPGERGAAGEIGLMQILPSTAWWINGHLIGRAGLQLSSLLDPSLNVDFGTAYLAELLRENGGDLARALTAYNSGSSWAAPNRYALEVLAILAAARRQFEPAEPLAGPGGAPASPPPRPAPAGS